MGTANAAPKGKAQGATLGLEFGQFSLF
jgi:hypothetical protein